MRRFRHSALILILLLGLSLGVVAPVAAQTASDGSTASTDQTVTVTVGELQGLVSTLENEARRAEFLDNLRALIASQPTEQAKAKEAPGLIAGATRSEEHTSELQSLMRISYAVFRLKQKTQTVQLLDSSTDTKHRR